MEILPAKLLEQRFLKCDFWAPASSSPGDGLEMLVIRPHPRLLYQRPWAWDPTGLATLALQEGKLILSSTVRMMKIPGTFSDSYSPSYDTHTSTYSNAFHIYIEQL